MIDPLLVFGYPVLLLPVVFLVLWLSARIAAARFQKFKSQVIADRDDFNIIQGATLTLLGLIIGFTFSMALGRYDQRKNLEEAEANAIGTEYVRADLLPAADAAKLRALLLSYLDQRILFYSTRGDLFYSARGDRELEQINATTTRLQGELWAVVQKAASAQPTAVTALAVEGINDVLNSQGYTQAAWWNRIPLSAWALMLALSVCSTMLLGLGARTANADSRLHLVLPLVVSIAFFLISDIDSPRRGTIRVVPQNLVSLSESLRAPVAEQAVLPAAAR